MPTYEVVTGFYTLVPWLSGGFLIFGIVSAIFLAITLGWWTGSKKAKKSTINFWLAFGWIPIFGVFVASVFAAGTIYYTARDNLSKQVEFISGVQVVTFVRGDDGAFVGRNNGVMGLCTLDANERGSYTINCDIEGS